MAPKPIVISILANGSQARAEFGRTASTGEKIGRGFEKMSLPAVAALGAMAVGAKSTIDAASDLQETISKTGEIFGPQAKEIEAFAASAEKSLGQSKRSALDAASTFGIIGEKAGLSGKDTAKFSKQFVTLASDLASFNNTSPEEAITAIGAAMRGESEPIRKYGVLLDDATLRNRALKLGLIDSVKTALTPQQKALAASKEILAQTSKAQGDFARTASAAANKERIQAAQTENLKAKIGKGLLPAYGALLDKTSDVIEYASEHEGQTKALAITVGALSGAVLGVNTAMKAGQAVMAVYTAATKVLDAAQDESARKMILGRAAIGAAGAGLIALSASGATGSGGIDKVTKAAGYAAAGFAVAGPWGAVAGAGLGLLDLGGQSEESAKKQQAFLDIQRSITDQASTLAGTLDGETGAITRNTKAQLAKSLAETGAYASGLKLGLGYDVVTRAAEGNKAAQAQVTEAARQYTQHAIAGADGTDELADAFLKAQKVTQPLTGSVSKFSTELSRAQTASRQTRNAVSSMAETSRDKATAMRGAGKAAGDGYRDGINKAKKGADNTRTAIGSMEDRARTSAQKMLSAGSNAGKGFHDGLDSWLGDIIAVAGQIADKVAKASRDKLKVKSPSRVMREIGEYAGMGLAEGIERTTPLAVRAIEDTVSRTTAAGQINLRQAVDLRDALDFSRPSALDVDLVGVRGTTVKKTVNINVNLDNRMSEAEMGRSYKRAIKAAERVGIA